MFVLYREDNNETTDGNSIQWSRLPGQQCAITNKYCGSLMADTSNGCSVTRFSPSGRPAKTYTITISLI